jgi:hypothetical protein
VFCVGRNQTLALIFVVIIREMPVLMDSSSIHRCTGEFLFIKHGLVAIGILSIVGSASVYNQLLKGLKVYSLHIGTLVGHH